jgi:hypothetical protein
MADKIKPLLRRIAKGWYTDSVHIRFYTDTHPRDGNDILVWAHCLCNDHPVQGWRVGQDYVIARGTDVVTTLQAAVDAAPKLKEG